MAFDEMSGGIPGYGGDVRDSYRGLARWLAEAPDGLLQARSRQAELFFRRMGITFAVYGDAESSERLIPFDVVPRIIGASEWAGLEAGLIQRVMAMNLFLADVYGPQECLKAGILPPELVLTNPHYVPEMQGRRPPRGVWVHIAGVDLVRTGEDGFYVLEDNCRTPSGVSYMLENREMMMRLFPDLFADYPVRPVETYTDMLLASLRACAP
ncbi:MAG TPA: circularly permuted type 2 ATP-grasp protein, partial [Brevundimonas sp.]